MPRYSVTFEDVAHLPAPEDGSAIELELSEYELGGFTDTSIEEGLFPTGILAVTKATAYPDDSGVTNGIRDGITKLFVSIDLTVDAEDEDAAESMTPPKGLLTKISDMLSTEFTLEGNWEVLMSEPLEQAQGETPAP